MQLYYIEPVYEALPCTVLLSSDESFHCLKVLRMRTGDTMHLSDGMGNLFTGRIMIEDSRNCMVEIIEVVKDYGRRPFRMHIAVAPTKNMARFEWFLEKATEMGIDEITPLLCEHSERQQIRTDRLTKIIVSAAKQSLKTYLPVLHEPTKFDSFMKMQHTANRFVAYVEEQQTVHLKTAYHIGDCCILIGPEGDFSKREMQQALQNGFKPVTLGPSRLRTETAAMVACHIINLLNES